MSVQALRTARAAARLRPRRGPDAEDYLQRMVSNDVARSTSATSCEALLLTAKARVIAPLVVLRRGPRGLPPARPSRGSASACSRSCAGSASPRRSRSSPRSTKPCSSSASGPTASAYPVADYGEPAWEVLDAEPGARRGRPPTSSSCCGSAPARRAWAARSTTASCPPRRGSTSERSASRRAAIPARSRSRGCTTAATRTAGSACCGSTPPSCLAYDAELVLDGKPVGRVTSAVRDPEGGVLALAYVRREVPRGRRAGVAARRGTALH